jgi:hypothetical protein
LADCGLSPTGSERAKEGLTDFCKTYEKQYGSASKVLQAYNGAKHNPSQRQAENFLYQSIAWPDGKRRNFVVRYGLGLVSSPAVCAESRSALRLLHLMSNRTLPVPINFPLRHKH